jgi:hypothetical protein
MNLEIRVGRQSRKWVGYLDDLYRTRTDADLRWLKEIDVCVPDNTHSGWLTIPVHSLLLFHFES